MTVCHRCGEEVDALRSPARIIGPRIVSFCAACVAASATAPATPAPAPRPAAPPPVVVAPLAAPRRRRSPARHALFASGALACALAYGVGTRTREAISLASSLATVRPEPPAVVSAPAPAPAPAPAIPAVVAPPPAPAPEPVPAPRVGTFVHPLATPERLLPTHDGRLFGAPRDGDRDPECGGGHCGVDLGDTVGTPVVAARDGVVEKIVRDSAASGGRYVQLRHADGMNSYYMHLDRVREDLAAHQRVAAGDPLGTLGRSGILHSPAHLHFALSVDHDGQKVYVDPMPYLRKATLLTAPRQTVARAEP